MAALVKEVHTNDRVVHQVFSNPRKVYQRRHVVEGELSSWSDARQHQNLCANVRPWTPKKKVTYVRCVNCSGTGEQDKVDWQKPGG